MQLKVFRCSPTAKLPSKAHPTDTCYDLYVDRDYRIGVPPQACSTGIRIIIPEGYWVKFAEKSGKALKGLSISGGIIDSAYSGELLVIASCTQEWMHVPAGTAICQFSIEKLIPSELVEITEGEYEAAKQLKDRQDAGFGSTGR